MGSKYLYLLHIKAFQQFWSIAFMILRVLLFKIFIKARYYLKSEFIIYFNGQPKKDTPAYNISTV